MTRCLEPTGPEGHREGAAPGVLRLQQEVQAGAPHLLP